MALSEINYLVVVTQMKAANANLEVQVENQATPIPQTSFDTYSKAVSKTFGAGLYKYCAKGTHIPEVVIEF